MQSCRELFVNPLLWTSHHFNLVGGQFVEMVDHPIQSTQDNTKTEENAKPPSDAELSATTPIPAVKSDAELFARTPIPAAKHRRLVDILVGKGRAFAKYGKGPDFFFTGIPVHRPHCTVFYRHGQPDKHVDGPLLVGHLPYGHVKGGRTRLFQPCPDPRGRLNRIGAEICEKRVAQVTPTEWTEDPYFACVLLALAQLQERKLDLPNPTTYTSRLLVTSMRDHDSVYLYDAEITSELLGALARPKSATRHIKWPVIMRRKLPIKPYNTFPDRLAAELVAPSCFSRTSCTASSDKLSAKRRREGGSGSPHKMRRLL
ncbi:uncharacterized protein DSM5745_09957 [Aspergillus mulundensis]|uniref:Uncharacterized protein n=1 Tax=Aspergillus mulundensis TaxID=1810919 RepID=A0A3D8QRU1_9EURO|nr:hypothetical protein DSM5745_09957 [Aspergillus mulundensis]RDW64546.1 hypothetical protein DSM5745_09957 [Aspergillus mulundensis]